jgi:MFS family permease
VLFTVAGLAGVAISVTGNELAQHFGRLRVVTLAIRVAALLSLLAGASAMISAPIAAVVVVLWNMTIYLDSSALTAGTVQAADPARRGATMGLHSMCGYAGGFAGPLVTGLALDLFGRETVAGWGFGFGHCVIVTLGALFALRYLAFPRDARRTDAPTEREGRSVR